MPTETETAIRGTAGVRSDGRTVAICGPPNVGKSTFFNRLTGLHQKVANYPGITVEKRIGRLELSNGQPIDLIDLPGIVGLNPRSEDERVAIEVLRGQSRTMPTPEAVILLLDSTNLRAHLRLVPEILSVGIPVLVVLNMADDLSARMGEVDTEALAKTVGAPVIAVSAKRGSGMESRHAVSRRDFEPSDARAIAGPEQHPGRETLGGRRRTRRRLPTTKTVHLGPAPRCGLPASGCRSADLPRGRHRSLPEHLHPSCAADGRRRRIRRHDGGMAGNPASRLAAQGPSSRRRVGWRPGRS